MTTVTQQVDPARLPQTWRDVVSPPDDIVERTLRHLRDLPPGVLDTDALARLVGAVADDPDTWTPLVVVDPDRRRYRLVYEDDRLDLWVLSWMPGQATGLHDHGVSGVALTTVQGSVTERHLVIGGEPTRRILTPGTVHTGPAGYIHAVGHDEGAPAVTIHAYSPPLVQVGQYRARPDGQVWREPQHGRQELLDHTIDLDDGRVG